MTTTISIEPDAITTAFPYKTSVSRNDAMRIAAFLVKRGASFMVYYAPIGAETTMRLSQHAAELLEAEGVLAK